MIASLVTQHAETGHAPSVVPVATFSLFDRLGSWLGWLLLPALAVMQLFDMRAGLDGRPALVSCYLIGFGVLAVVSLPWLVRRLPRLGPSGRVLLGAFALLLLWALWSSWHTVLPRVFKPVVTITREYLVVPNLTALLTLLAGWGLAAAVNPADRIRVLRWAAIILVASTLVAGPRNMLAVDSNRLATGLGGAAVFHVVMLLCLAVAAGCWLTTRSRTDLVTAAGALACLLLTGSRAGLVTLALFLGLVVLSGVVQPELARRLRLPALVGTVVVLGILLALPSTRRMFQLDEVGRRDNLRTAMNVFTAPWNNQWTGIGSGRMWPWYYFETGHGGHLWKSLIQTGFGRGTSSAHSVYLEVLVELGLVGMVLLVIALGALVWRVVRLQRDGASAVDRLVGLALVASLVAFAFDTYLFKNFGLSLWWWFAAASCVGLAPQSVLPETPIQGDLA